MLTKAFHVIQKFKFLFIDLVLKGDFSLCKFTCLCCQLLEHSQNCEFGHVVELGPGERVMSCTNCFGEY
jgi:hypothetical protein